MITICHPNHCDNSGLPNVYISLELDTLYSTYSDDSLVESISILTNWVIENPLSLPSTNVHVYKVNRGSVILIINLVNIMEMIMMVIKINLYNNLKNGEINMLYRIIDVEIFPPMPSSTPSPTINSVLPVSSSSSTSSPNFGFPSSSPSPFPFVSSSTTPASGQFSTLVDE